MTRRIAPALFAAGVFAGALFASGAAQAQEVRYINPPALHDASKYYTHVITVPAGARTVYVAGQVGFDQSGKPIAADKPTQMARAFQNLRTALQAAGARPEHVVKVTLLFVDYTESDLGLLDKEMSATFPRGKLPTSTLIGVQRLARDGLLFEIEAIAAIP